MNYKYYYIVDKSGCYTVTSIAGGGSRAGRISNVGSILEDKPYIFSDRASASHAIFKDKYEHGAKYSVLVPGSKHKQYVEVEWEIKEISITI